MNKKGYIIILLLLNISYTYAQNICNTYNTSNGSLINTLESRNTSQDNNKLTASHLESIAKYWKAVCECESGTSDENTAKELSSTIFENKSHYTDNYIVKGKIYKKDLSPLGNLQPTTKIYTKSTCLQGGSANIKTAEDLLGCTTEAQTFYKNAQDSQQFGKGFFRAYCECVSGTNSQRISSLVKEMKINHNNYHAYKVSNDPIIQTQPLDGRQCRTNDSQANFQKSAKKPIDKKRGLLIKDEYMQLLNQLSSNSKNANFKKLVSDLNETKQTFSKGREIFKALNILDVDEFNFVENLAQGAKIVEGIFNLITDKPSPEQEEGKRAIRKINNDIELVYNQINALPTYFDFDKKMMNNISTLEKNIATYEKGTVTNRLLVLKYLNTSPDMTIDEVRNTAKEIEDNFSNNGLDFSINKITNYEKLYNNPSYKHLGNKGKAFGRVLNNVNHYKAKYYKKQGNFKKANELEIKNNYDVNDIDAFKLLATAYKDKNYFGSIKYYQQIKEYLKSKDNTGFLLFYIDIPNIDYEINGTWRHETVAMTAAGILSYIKTNDLAQARQELEFIKWLNDNHKKFNTAYALKKSRKKAHGFSDQEYKNSLGQSLAVEKTVEAILLSKEGNFEDAKLLINEAIQLNIDNPLNQDMYGPWIRLNKLEILIRTNAYKDAKKLAIKIKKMHYVNIIAKTKFYNHDDFKFQLAFMKYKKENYQGAINDVTVLEKEHPNSKRLILLKYKLYEAIKDDKNITLYKSKLLTKNN